jgi:hypothetical protein
MFTMPREVTKNNLRGMAICAINDISKHKQGNKQMTDRLEIAKRVYDHAVANYPEKRGQARWDVIVECMGVEDIAEEFEGDTFEEMLADAERYVKLQGEAERNAAYGDEDWL